MAARHNTEVAHLVIIVMWSIRTLLWMLEADEGDTWSSPLLSVVTLGSMTIARGVMGVGAAERVSVSSRTLTKLLMVLRIFLMLYREGAGEGASLMFLSLEAYKLAIVAIVFERSTKTNLHFSLWDGGGKRKRDGVS